VAAVRLSAFAEGLRPESAFDVLAVAKRFKADGKDVVELQIGDSPFPTTEHGRQAGISAINEGRTNYCPSRGLPEFREAVADHMNRLYSLDLTGENIVVGHGAKIFEQFFCEVFLEPGDEVLVFSPRFPTYAPNIERRGAVPVYTSLKQENEFRPSIPDVEAFVARGPKARAIFLNSPHNPTGGVATAEDIRAICNLIRGKNVALFSDEPYNHMAWEGSHYTPLSEPEMLEQCVAAYTFSKSYSMSGWRLGYAVCSSRIAEVIGHMLNTSLSCIPPYAQLAGAAALKQDSEERDRNMNAFRGKVELLADALQTIEELSVSRPHGTFYVFPNVARICNRLGITSHGLAMYLLEAADDRFGVACLGGECFGEDGAGFIRFSCAEPDERLREAVDFLPKAFERQDRVSRYLKDHPEYVLSERYPTSSE
jgi:aspartate aminotransferase